MAIRSKTRNSENSHAGKSGKSYQPRAPYPPIPANRVRSPIGTHAQGSPDVSGIKIFQRTSDSLDIRFTDCD
jgi:hypothetical protein